MGTHIVKKHSAANADSYEQSQDPDLAYRELQLSKKITSIKELLPADSPLRPDCLRFVCISDTHGRIDKLRHKLPEGDVLLHAGDFSMTGRLEEVIKFNEYMGTLNFKHKIVIAGNHELTFDTGKVRTNMAMKLCEERGFRRYRDILTNCTYLQDESINIYGINVYGSPWTPEFCGWAFNLPRGRALAQKWDHIPDNTDILITHGPPLGHGDRVEDGSHVGCVDLLKTVQQRVRPSFHIFGHIHEGYGITSDGTTTFINASSSTVRYRPINQPIIFDVKLKNGIVKE